MVDLSKGGIAQKKTWAFKKSPGQRVSVFLTTIKPVIFYQFSPASE